MSLNPRQATLNVRSSDVAIRSTIGSVPSTTVPFFAGVASTVNPSELAVA